MLSSSKSKSAKHEEQTESGRQLHVSRGTLASNGGSGSGGAHKSISHLDEAYDERQQFLISDKSSKKRKAKLAREETTEEEERSCFRGMLHFIRRKRILIPLLILICIAAIYCLPFVEIEPRIPKRLPDIPFNYKEGPLRPSSFSQFKIERLFQDQIHGPESVALDSLGNMYLAIEGGFILYAHLNKSSPPKRNYYENYDMFIPPKVEMSPIDNQRVNMNGQNNKYLDLVKIAELNGFKQTRATGEQQKRGTRGASQTGSDLPWRRECQLDEKVYGSHLFSGGQNVQTATNNNEIDSMGSKQQEKRFKSNVLISRCSKPLGIRLSPDERYLYIVDTLSGLFRVHLNVPERPHSTNRLVTKLVDFRTNKSSLLPVTNLDQLVKRPPEPFTLNGNNNSNDQELTGIRVNLGQTSYLNVSLRAVDDLVIDYGAGSQGGDIIYMTDASQAWQAVSFLYDMLEGRPSGVVLRYDTNLQQLSVLNPIQVAHVRTSGPDVNLIGRQYDPANITTRELPFPGIGAPQLDENDVFDDRPLHFPNGLELTYDRQALLIADTTNKRIIKHYIRGPRRGTSDLWAWTPHYPDNIRRGFDSRHETYWVVGCGQDMTNKIDLLAWLQSWPRLRKYILKNMYLFGWTIETFGAHIIRSTSVRDFGYSIRMGHSVAQNFCPGMMVIQYNNHGDIVRSVYGKEFPNDLSYYSQVNEVIDAKNQEHALYLSSPSYSYVTKLILPTDSFDAPSPIENNLK